MRNKLASEPRSSAIDPLRTKREDADYVTSQFLEIGSRLSRLECWSGVKRAPASNRKKEPGLY